MEIRTSVKYRHERCNDLNKIINPFIVTDNTPSLVINPNIIGEICTTFDQHSKGAYDGLIAHLDKNTNFGSAGYIINLYDIKIDKNLPIVDAVVINLNSNPIGYYLPDTKEIQTTEWTWHLTYTNTVIAWVWPQIIQGLLKIDPEIFDDCELEPEEDKPIVTLDTLKKVNVKPKVKEVI